MLRSLARRRPSHATVVAYLALFVALGGTSAVALSGSNTVFSDDIANDNFNSPTEGQGGLVASDLRAGSVTGSEVADSSLTGNDVFNNTISGADITNGSLTGADVFDNTIGGADVTNNSLSGADINESSLARVPDADKLDGVDSTQFQRVGLVHFGAPPQDGPEVAVIRWPELGAAFVTDGDEDSDGTLKIANIGSQTIRVRYGPTQINLFSGSSSSAVDVSTPTTFIVWSEDGARSWLVSCVTAGESTLSIHIRCHGLASRVD
jgi:hypothetical protein